MNKLVFLLAIISSMAYTQGKEKHGPFQDYYKNGNLKTSGTYERGKKLGHWKYYYPNGKLKKEMVFAPAGIWNGHGRRFSNTGKLQSEARPYKNKSVQETHYFENGGTQRVFILEQVGEKKTIC